MRGSGGSRVPLAARSQAEVTGEGWRVRGRRAGRGVLPPGKCLRVAEGLGGEGAGGKGCGGAGRGRVGLRGQFASWGADEVVGIGVCLG